MATSAPKPAPKLVTKGQGAPTPDSNEDAPVIKKKSKKKTILVAGIAAIVLGAAGGAAFYFTGASDNPVASADPDAPAEEAKAKSEPEQPPLFVVVEPFTVNLQHEGPSDQFLQISFSLQLGDRKQEELFKLYQPQARSRLLLLLSGKKASEISSVEGKKKLAEEIVDQLKIPFSQQSAPLDIKDVFFTSFVIQ